MGGGYLDPEPLCRVVKGGGFLNRTLQNICIGEGLSKLGVKAELQQRIIDSTFLPTASPQEATPSIPILPRHDKSISRLMLGPLGLQLYARTNNAPAFQRLKSMIDNPNSIQPGGMASASPSVTGTPAPPNSHLNGAAYAIAGVANVNGFRPLGHPSMFCYVDSLRYLGSDSLIEIEFKPSPYFEIKEQIGNPSPCEGMQCQIRLSVAKLILITSNDSAPAHCQDYFETRRLPNPL